MTENYMFVTAPGAEVSVAPIDSETKAPSPVLTFHQVSTDDRREGETPADRRRHLENKTDRHTETHRRWSADERCLLWWSSLDPPTRPSSLDVLYSISNCANIARAHWSVHLLRSLHLECFQTFSQQNVAVDRVLQSPGAFRDSFYPYSLCQSI